ncbi:hypothetical protein H6P81_008392 [Aristolochia fimbriata]|uniref:Uncharacterized protein n=1 Tax=Aristolochia fimbriata TaxID=158543 RepID=A0AAV7F391_ARIFI|nr:hypothetical protein H6P81_008392 [Aristolochia fimbriata]
MEERKRKRMSRERTNRSWTAVHRVIQKSMALLSTSPSGIQVRELAVRLATRSQSPTEEIKGSTDGIEAAKIVPTKDIKSSASAADAPTISAMAAADSNGGFWTDEKHVSFLNRLEASFVKTMLQRSDLSHPWHSLPLHRFGLSDFAESTLRTRCPTRLQIIRSGHTQYSDSEVAAKKNTQRHHDRRKADGKITFTSSTDDNNASQDQVVPELARNKGSWS